MLATSHPKRYESVLVAGAGDVGRRVARQLLADGHQVFALRRGEAAEADGIRWLRGDLTQPATLRDMPAVDALIYAAAPDARDEDAYRALYVDGLRHIVDALPVPPRRTVFVSSSAVYGEHGGDWVDETTPVAPGAFSGRIMRDAEQWLASRGVGGVSLRLAGLYGPGRTQLFERLREGQARVPRGQGVYANRIHVDDAASALALVLSLPDPAPVYVGVDDTPLPIDVLYDHLAGLLGVPVPAEGPGPAGIGNKRLSNALLRASGFRCRWPDARAGYAALLAG
ncbi:SDR family oxidoreductase [Luteibacter sp. ME-Dv--P-043b]|uniref:SDR family oxidoreductase n=1 Tax=Luteibacter sp. ME-Dv--P-043b TaxID=3040291 RepID=UPI002555326A|nr:SDR family oxidoreductase [Luteibacter sp. ME-Dv--P-043b]